MHSQAETVPMDVLLLSYLIVNILAIFPIFESADSVLSNLVIYSGKRYVLLLLLCLMSHKLHTSLVHISSHETYTDLLYLILAEMNGQAHERYA